MHSLHSLPLEESPYPLSLFPQFLSSLPAPNNVPNELLHRQLQKPLEQSWRRSPNSLIKIEAYTEIGWGWVWGLGMAGKVAAAKSID